MAFQKAERRRAKARVLLAGPSGSGKSYSALILARGLVGEGGRIAAVDTEHGSLSLYSDITGFDVCAMAAPFSPQAYIQLIREAASAGYDALVIDSITHEWAGPGGILDIKDKMTGTNDYAKWGKLTPLHDSFVQAMLTAPMHIVATVRSRQDYALEEDERGKQVPKKLGMAPQQRDGIDYEFTICFDLDIVHNAHATKDRTGLFGADFGPVTPEYGDRLARWLDAGADTPEPEPVSIREEEKPERPTPAPRPAAAQPEPDPLPDQAEALKPLREQCRLKAKNLGLPGEAFLALIKGVHTSGKLVECSEEELRELLKRLNAAAKGAEKASKEAA